MTVELRLATIADIAEMQRIRMAVRENRLVTARLTDEDYVRHLRDPARAWVGILDGVIAGFAVADRATANIWALFVDPRYERRGVGRALHDTMMNWMFASVPVVPVAWLDTEQGTRAERFYRAAGWTATATRPSGELRFELREDEWMP